ncbi:CoA transferase [Rhodococcus sp. NPDC058521]|uniref:CoA transferase n=1 Tax=Rhodococcus sp. NPDC058521 TaxID=3346536 RepID=UPI003661AA4F
MREHDSARDWAESGILSLTGRADGSPIMPPGVGASAARTMSTFLAAATMDTRARISVDGAALLGERAAFTGRTRNGRVSVGGHTRLLPTLTGWAAISCARADDVALLGALVEQDLSTTDPWPAVEDWLAGRDVEEIESRIELLGIAGGVVPTEIPTTRKAVNLCPGGSRPIAGALVVDFSALWAGPLCAHLLGLGGARVIKVETPQRPDGARRGNPDFYDLLHGGHESVCLDPSTPEGRKALSELVTRADIVIEASRPRALARFGLDAERFVDAGCVWVSITARGRESDRIGFGDDVAGSAGLVALDNDGCPVFVGDAIADPLAGLTAATVVLSSPPGRGRLCDISMSDVIASTLSSQDLATNNPSESAFGTHLPVAPRRRPLHTPAPTTGENTVGTLASLGIAVP